MKPVKRLPPPKLFAENSERWREQWLSLKSRNPKAQFNWYTAKDPKDAKGQRANLIARPVLKEMTDDHCTFCDAYPVESTSPETIEHFQPKSKFPEKAYEWGNLFYCCGRCQEAKQEKWNESLLKPDDPNYQFADHFDIDFGTGKLDPKTKQAQITIQLYGLNDYNRPLYRKLELRKWDRAGQGQEECEEGLNEYAYRFMLTTVPQKLITRSNRPTRPTRPTQ